MAAGTDFSGGPNASLGVFGYAGTRHATTALLDPDLEVSPALADCGARTIIYAQKNITGILVEQDNTPQS